MKVITLAILEAHTGAHMRTVVGRNYGQACSRAAEVLNQLLRLEEPLPVARLTLADLRALLHSRRLLTYVVTDSEHTL